MGRKERCAWYGCKKTTRLPNSSWKSGLFLLDETFHDERHPTNNARSAFLFFCPEHGDKRT